VSMEAITAARKLTLPPRDKFVLLALADYANDDGEAYPKQSTLAEWTCYNRTTVNEALANLERAGLIETQQTYRDDGGKSYKRYRLTFLTPHVGEADKGMSARPTRVCRPEQQPLVGEADSKNPQQGTHKKEPKKKGAREHFDPLSVDLPANVSRDVWRDFIAYRRERRLPTTPTHTRRLLEKLSAAGADADAMLAQTIENGWQGVFDLKDTAQRAEPHVRAAQQATSLLAHLEGRRAS
jgi:DNA-binding MarR family transcriptional regulator